MYYTVLRRDIPLARAGAIFTARRDVYRNGEVLVNLTKLDLSKFPAVEVPFTRVVYTQEGAREWFTKPTTDFDDAIEQSIMICEAAEIY